MTTRTAVALWTLALLCAGAATTLIYANPRTDDPALAAALASAVGVAFVGAGLIARSRRPENRIGTLMILTGFTWFLAAPAQADEPALFSAGVALGSITFAFFGWLILAFPGGRLESRAARVFVLSAFFTVTVLNWAIVLVADAERICAGCPENVFAVAESDALADGLVAFQRTLGVVLSVALAAIVAWRWLAAMPALRRTLTPVYATSIAAVLVLAVRLALQSVYEPGARAVDWLLFVLMLLVPLAFLFGVLRARLARSSVGRLVVELGRTPASEGLRDALARALGDPTLDVAYWLPEEQAFVDEEGRPMPQPEPDGPRFATVVERRGQPVAALVHDASLLEDPALIEAVTAAAGLALENERGVRKLRRSEARNRALLNAIPDLLFRIGADGRYRDFKAEDEAVLIAEPSAIVGRSIHELLPADAAERIMACGLRALEEGSVESVEYELTLGGEVRLFEGRIVVSGDDEFLLMVRDFTERHRREEELHRVYVEVEEQFAQLERERDFSRTVVESAPSIFCLLDDEGGIVRFNRACARATGYEEDEAVRGRRFWEVFADGEDADGLRADWEAAAAGSPPDEREHAWRARDGSELVVASSLTPLVDHMGRRRYVLVGLDVTQRKRQEAELRASRARLVEAGDRERRRLERNLHDGAQQRLVSLSISLRLAAGKLRTDPDEAERLLRAASEELTNALAELRELARGIHPAILSERGLAPALEALAGRSPMPVDVRVEEERLPEPVEAAAYYVVSEALANVVKYAEAESVSVCVGREGATALVEVRDDGVGGADPALGTGLRGLADRVEALNGSLEVESRAGLGTEVRARIPLADKGK